MRASNAEIGVHKGAVILPHSLLHLLWVGQFVQIIPRISSAARSLDDFADSRFGAFWNVNKDTAMQAGRDAR